MLDAEVRNACEVIMIGVLNRYFAFMLVIAFVLPLWLSAFAAAPVNWTAVGESTFATITLLGFAFLVKIRPGFNVRGHWRSPHKDEWKAFAGSSLLVLVVDYGSKVLFFEKDQAARVEIFRNFGLQSAFHENKFELPNLYPVLLTVLLCFIGALFFRYSVKLLDRIWLISAACTLGATVAISLERIVFGGVHDSFYLSGSPIWVCPNCALKFPSGFAWTPSDFFLNAAAVPVGIFVISYFWPVRGARRSNSA